MLITPIYAYYLSSCSHLSSSILSYPIGRNQIDRAPPSGGGEEEEVPSSASSSSSTPSYESFDHYMSAMNDNDGGLSRPHDEEEDDGTYEDTEDVGDYDYAIDDGVNRIHTRARSDSSLWFINYTPGQQPSPLLVNDISPDSSSNSSNSRILMSSSSGSSTSSSIVNSSPQLLIRPLQKIAEHPSSSSSSSSSIRVKNEHQPGVKDKKVGE
jgi:hypothetical protein